MNAGALNGLWMFLDAHRASGIALVFAPVSVAVCRVLASWIRHRHAGGINL
jgi:hypothetical protein